jgi:hypothetical protein
MARTAVAIVEDEGIVAEEVRDTLTRLGYDVPVMAATAEKALKGVLQTEVGPLRKARGVIDGVIIVLREALRAP